MRHESITDNITIAWRDERQGRTQLNKLRQLGSVLDHYGFKVSAVKLPLSLENDDFVLTCHSSSNGPPYQLIVDRKPQGQVQQAAWEFAKQSRMARIIIQDNQLGVLFLDEDAFVPFDCLSYDPTGGFSIS